MTRITIECYENNKWSIRNQTISKMHNINFLFLSPKNPTYILCLISYKKRKKYQRQRSRKNKRSKKKHSDERCQQTFVTVRHVHDRVKPWRLACIYLVNIYSSRDRVKLKIFIMQGHRGAY